MRNIKIIVFLLALTILFCGCENKSDQYVSQETSPELTTLEETPIEVADADETETTIDDEPEYKEVSGTVIAGCLEFDGDEAYYSYTAPVSGIYRFDFDISNVNFDYRFILIDSKDEEICNEHYDGYENGKSCELKANQKYRIVIKQISGDPEYTIKIGVPNEIATINGNEFSGELSFKDKKDKYIYTPSVSGQYRFDFDISDVNNDYKFLILSEKQEEIVSGYYYNEGVNCRLEAGQNYYIHIIQREGISTYKINIGIPKEVKQISNGVYTGNIKYIGQMDRYTSDFSRGKYFIEFSDINAESRIKVEIKSSNNTVVLTAYPTEEPLAFEIEENDTYKIYVKQKDDFTDYKIRIYK